MNRQYHFLLAILLLSWGSNVCAATVNHTTTQHSLHELAENLDLHYQLESNFTKKPHCPQEHKTCFSAALTLTSPVSMRDNRWTLYFSHIRPILGTSSHEFTIRHINGDLHALSPAPAFEGIKANKRYYIPFQGAAWIISRSDILPNYYLTYPGLTPEVIAATREENLHQFVRPFLLPEQQKTSKQDHHPLVNTQVRYTQNQAINGAAKNPLPRQRIVPTIKTTQITGKELNLSKGIALKGISEEDIQPALLWLEEKGIGLNKDGIPFTVIISPAAGTSQAEDYNLQVNQNSIQLTSTSQHGVFYGLMSLSALVKNQGTHRLVPMGQYQDSPRYGFRGLHLDVSRNFHSLNSVKTLIRQMARLKLNRLHLHMADDEGWRLAIPGLPELTELGSQRCHDLTETRCLLPQLGAGPFANNTVNGYYNREDYLSLLNYAGQHHIQVIPSLDMPGHSRAAIKAMELRYQRMSQQGLTEKASQYRLIDPNDTTEYRSIQHYNDNSINPCLPSSYRFIKKVLTELIKMHTDAGQPIHQYHIGADEAPGAWKQSPACATLISQSGTLNSVEQLTGYFIQKVATMVNDAGVMPAGWGDGMSHLPLDKLKSKVQVNVWGTLNSLGAREAHHFTNLDQQTILSIPDVLYFDFPYEANPQESGYYWASRQTNSYKVFQFMPDNLPAHAGIWRDANGQPLPLKDELLLLRNKKVTGIQAQVWSEVIRTPEQLEYMLFPRLAAFAERAWHQAQWEPEYQGGVPTSDQFTLTLRYPHK